MSAKVRTPWRVIKKRIRCYLFGHPEVVHCGDLTRKGHRAAPLHTCPHCNEILMKRYDVQKHGNKEA